MKKSLIIMVAVLWAPLLGASVSAGANTIIDLHDQFPDAQGQKGFYAYGYQAGREVPYRQLTREGAYYFSTPEQPWNIPYWQRSDSPWLTVAPSAIDQCGTVFSPENAVLAWRAPQTNTYALTGQFRLHPVYGGGAVTVYIWQNGTPLWSVPLEFLDSADFNLPAVALNGWRPALFRSRCRGG